MSIDLKRYSNFLSIKKATKEVLSNKMTKLESSLSVITSNIGYLEEAKDIMNTVSILAQEESKDVIESLVTHAIQSVFGCNYSFEIESKINRNQPEIFLYVVVDDVKYLLRNADDNMSGGVVDIIAFALRIVLWAMHSPRTDNVLILDEPFKNLDGERSTLLGEVIREISETFNLQFIISTRLSWLEDIANVCYTVRKKDKISVVEKLK